MSEFEIIKCANHDEWLKARGHGIGGSDASSIIGKNPFKSNQALWEEKSGRIKPDDISNKPYVIFGKKAEEHIRELFKLEFPLYQVEHSEFDIIRNNKYPYMQASLDGTIIDDEGRRGILEIKTCDVFSSMANEKWTDGIPDNYYIQCLHYLAVTGFEFVILKARLASTYQGMRRASIKHYYISAEERREDIEYLIEAEGKFWASVKLGIKPNLMLPTI